MFTEICRNDSIDLITDGGVTKKSSSVRPFAVYSNSIGNVHAVGYPTIRVMEGMLLIYGNSSFY